ncbi:hypothetical protein O181_057093 [Austropuccinia psidii MF-1]|uniref:RNA-directed DNA polymerase n=1 Tax=Austropuccinia psidii MF-1 TaxID=1389203 RepID=A0A9Q3EEC5_9BASI|nr:hypothetical protein [Austropuccinia psidii MF-1]
MSELPEKIPLFILDSNESTSLFITHYTKWVVYFPSFPSFESDFFIMDSPKGEYLILGYDFLCHFKPMIDWKNGLITYDSSGITSSTSNDFSTAVNSVALVGELKTPSLPPSIHIPSIIASQSLLLSRDEVFKKIKDVGEDVSISSLHFFQGDMDLPPLSFHASLEDQWDEEEEPEEIETVLEVVPPAYNQYLDVFSKVKSEKPPPHHAFDHHIELEGLLSPVGFIYYLSKNYSETLWAYISENVEKGFMRPSSSSTRAPVLFFKKKDGGLCLSVDYFKLNAVTRKNRYPVPPINQLLTILNSSTIFSKINLVNDIFADFLDIFVVVYLDDIMVFSSSEEEHFKHVASVLQRRRDNNLFAKALRCVFHASSVEYLGYVFSIEGLKMDCFKVQRVLNWPQPKNIKELKSFLFFANFYRHFIKKYSKKSLLSLPSLKKILPPSSMGKLLVNDSGKHPIAFDICKLLPTELNYEIHDEELFGIVWALKRWRAFLLPLSDSFEVVTDHSSLQYFMSSKVLIRHQARWAEFLSEFQFSITCHPGSLATLPDSLSNWDDVYPERGVDFISKNP